MIKVLQYPNDKPMTYENEITIGGTVVNACVNPNDHYSDFELECEVEVNRFKDAQTCVNGHKVTSDTFRVATDPTSTAAFYIKDAVHNGDFIRLRGRLDNAYAYPVIVINDKCDILYHQHEYEG